jgi:hypothetical protein
MSGLPPVADEVVRRNKSSDFGMITFWIVLCGGILITLVMTGVFDSLTTNEVGRPVARRR